MKHLLSAILLFTSLFPAIAQITVTPADMPSEGDTMRYSNAQTGLDVSAGPGGANQTWDFSNLNSTSQFVDRYSSVSQTDLTYQIVFGLPFGENASNLAKPNPDGLALPSQLPITITDMINFYKSDNDEFSQTGFGAKLNGIALPVTYSSRDVLCPLPLSFNDQSSGDFDYQIEIPTIGFYGKVATRTNIADGWGTLILPSGTYNVLRLKSILQAVDSIAISIDPLPPFGINIPVPDVITYSYYASGFKFPVMQITSNDLGGNEVVSKAIYRDMLAVDGIADNVSGGPEVKLYPNPASEIAVVQTELLSKADISYNLMDALGKTVYSVVRNDQSPGTAIEILPLETLHLGSGIYFLRISTGNTTGKVLPLMVNNP